MEPYLAASSYDKQSVLDSVWDSCQPAQEGSDPVPLINQLRANESDARSGLQGGMSVKASNTNGHSALAFDPATANLSPLAYARIFRDLIDLYGEAVVFMKRPPCNITSFKYQQRVTYDLIEVTVPNATPNDEQIDGYMRNRLVPITESQSDFSLLIVSGNPLMI